MAFWRRHRDRDLDDEIQAHLRMAANEMGPDAARRDFGNVGLVKEVTREVWGWAPWEALLQDLRYAFRILRKNPGYTLTAVLSLALGIGANTAIFSLLDAIMLKALPVHNPQELVSIGDPTAVGRLSGGSGGSVVIFSYPFYQRFREQNTVFQDVYASGRSERLNLSDSDEHPHARFVSGNFFTVLGVSLLRGRSFAGNSHLATVISFDYWERHFQGDPAIIGRKLTINGAAFTIVGVAPRDFFGDIVGYETDLWLPIEAEPEANPGREYLKDPNMFWLMLMGRLKPGVSLAEAYAKTNAIGLSLINSMAKPVSTPEELRIRARDRISVQPAARGFSRIRRDYSKPLFLLMTVVGLVLLICCTNVANLQLARATSRAREIGLRFAIGAGRMRLLGQLLTESLLLAAAGGLAGVFFAVWIGHLLLQIVAYDHRAPLTFQLSGNALLFTAAVSLLAGLLFGLAPALFATKTSVISDLKESRGGRSQTGAQRFEKALVVFQIVLSWVLLFGAGLFIRTLQHLETADLGYQRESLLVVDLDPVASRYQDARMNQLGQRLLDVFRGMPGVASVTVSENGLFSGTSSYSGLTVEGLAKSASAGVMSDRVGPNYFETIGTPILSGRGIEAQDIEGAPRVAVINQTMARHYFPDGRSIGRRISTDEGKEWLTIVGVTQDAKQRNLRDPVTGWLYTAYLQHQKDDPIDGMRLEIRTRLPGSRLAQSIRREIEKVDPNLQIRSVSPAQELIDDELLQERMIAKLSGAFSVLALVLASVGLYGVMSYLTQRRTVEVGIRMALGASRSSVVGKVLKESLTLAVTGLLVGSVAAYFLGRLVSSSLYGVQAFDPLSVASSSLVVFAAALLAGWLPARRAARVDPMVALRTE